MGVSSSSSYKYLSSTGEPPKTFVIPEDSLDFFSFGCWNKDECKKDNAFSRIIEHLEKSKFDFGIISGDNIYPDKSIDKDGKKVKIYEKDRFIKGKECLHRLKIPIYSILGNHDIESCKVYNEEQQSDKLWFLKNYYSIIYQLNGFNVLFIFIDTNLFEKEKILNEDTCYKHFNIKEKKAKMIEWISTQLILQCDHIFIVGHEPIFGYKDKKKNKVTPYQKFSDLFDILKDSNRKMLYYICADIHNYQNVEIKIGDTFINEIISGTGGASPDLLKKKLLTEKDFVYDGDYSGKKFEARLIDKQDGYGYVKFLITKANIQFLYTQVFQAVEIDDD